MRVRTMSIKINLDEILEKKFYDEILEGKWVPGTRIKIERIMEDYTVSRTPVIQALKKMQSRGLVNFTKKGHFEVPKFSRKDISDMKEIRIMLEVRALDEIEKEKLDVNYEKLYSICENEEIFSKRGEDIRARGYDVEFHKELVGQAQNIILSDVHTRTIEKYMFVNYYFASHPVRQHEVAYNDHNKILNMMSDGNYQEAKEALEQHIIWTYQKIRMSMQEEQENI